MSPIEHLLDQAEWTPVPNSAPAGDLPYATHEGVLRLGDQKLRVVQLNTGERVIDQCDFLAFFGAASMDELLGVVEAKP